MDYTQVFLTGGENLSIPQFNSLKSSEFIEKAITLEKKFPGHIDKFFQIPGFIEEVLEADPTYFNKILPLLGEYGSDFPYEKVCEYDIDYDTLVEIIYHYIDFSFFNIDYFTTCENFTPDIFTDVFALFSTKGYPDFEVFSACASEILNYYPLENTQAVSEALLYYLGKESIEIPDTETLEIMEYVLKYAHISTIVDMLNSPNSEFVANNFIGNLHILNKHREEQILEQIKLYRAGYSPVSNTYFKKSDPFFTKLLSYMETEGIASIKREDLLSKASPLYKQFGVFSEAKLLQPYKVITPEIVKAFISEEELDNYELSYNTKYEPSNPTELGLDFVTVNINFTDKYLRQLIPSNLMSEYEQLAEEALKHRHIVLPKPGKTLGWVRFEVVDKKTWVISEIQSDWGVVKRWAKHTRMEPIIEELLANYDDVIMQAILDIARRNGVKHIYMRDSDHPAFRGKKEENIMFKMLYEKTPKKFRFHKVEAELGLEYGTQTYWYRTARKVCI